MVKNANSFGRARSERTRTSVNNAKTELFDRAKDDRKIVGFRMDPELHHELKAKAFTEGTTLQEILTQAVEEYMRTHN